MADRASDGKLLPGHTVRPLTRPGSGEDTLAELTVAISGTNSNPFRLAGTDALLGRTIDDTLLAELGKLVQKQVSPMRSTVTAAHHRRLVAVVAAQRLVRELWSR